MVSKVNHHVKWKIPNGYKSRSRKERKEETSTRHLFCEGISETADSKNIDKNRRELKQKKSG